MMQYTAYVQKSVSFDRALVTYVDAVRKSRANRACRHKVNRIVRGYKVDAVDFDNETFDIVPMTIA